MPVPKDPTTLGGHLRKRRLQLGLFQSVATRRLRVSTVTLSKWERDVLYPAWSNQPKVTEYLGFNPFTDPARGRPLGNGRVPVVLLSSFGYQLRQKRLQMRLPRKVLAEQLGISWKTIWGWETNRRRPSQNLKEKLERFWEVSSEKLSANLNLLIRRRFRAANRQCLQGSLALFIGTLKSAAFCGLTAAAVRRTTFGLLFPNFYFPKSDFQQVSRISNCFGLPPPRLGLFHRIFPISRMKWWTTRFSVQENPVKTALILLGIFRG